MKNKIKKFDLQSTENQPTSSTLQPAFGTLQSAFGKLPLAFIQLPETLTELPPAFGKTDEDELVYSGKKVFEECHKQGEAKYEKSENASSDIVRDINKVILPAKGMNFYIRLIGAKEIIREESDGKYQRTVYKFAILLASDEYVQDVEATELENFLWVKKATKGRAYIEGQQGGSAAFRRLVHEALEIGLSKIDTEIYYIKNGWKRINDGSLVYVCNHGIVGQPNGLIHGCDELQFQIDSDVTSFQNFHDFMGMQKITCQPEFTRCFMTFTSLSVMASLFEEAGFPVKFILGVLGTTNTMKTSIALVFTTIFNALKPQKPEVTFSSTKNGIETMISKYSDGVLLVDDFMPADSKKKQSELNSKLELLCRSYGDRAAKKRMLDFCEKKVEYPVKGCCVFTGEHLTGVESSRTRILVLKLEKGAVQRDVLTFYQRNPLVLPTYVYHFIAYLQRYVEWVLEFIAQSVAAYRAAANYKVARLNEMQAIMFTVVDMMEQYWKNAGFVSADSSIGDAWKESIREVVMCNERQLAEVSVSEVIIQALREKIFQCPQDCKPLDEIQKSDHGKIYFDDRYIYMRSEDLYMVVKEYCSKFDYDFYLQKQMVIDKLKEADLLDTQINEKGHECAARKLKQGKGITARFLFLKRKRIEADN